MFYLLEILNSVKINEICLPVDETTVDEEDEAGELHEGEFPRPESASQPDPELPGPEASVLGCDVTVERLV